MAGRGRDDLVKAVVGEDRERVTAVGLIRRATHPAALLQAADGLREAGERALGEQGKNAHPQRALLGLFSGATKVLQSREQLIASGMGLYEDWSPPAIKAIGVLELLAAIGLILPAVTGIAPILVPLAATGLVATMVGAMVVHARRGELSYLALNLVLLVLAAMVAWGRFGPYAF